MTQHSNATAPQVQYITRLLAEKRMQHWRRAESIRTTTDLANPDFRHEAQRLQDAELMVQVYEAIQLPADLTEKQASAWIDALKGAGDALIAAALDRPATAARIGLTDLLDSRRAAIERAI